MHRGQGQELGLMCVMFEVCGGLPGRGGRWVTGLRPRGEVKVETELWELSLFRRGVTHEGCLPRSSPQAEAWRHWGSSQSPEAEGSSSCYSVTLSRLLRVFRGAHCAVYAVTMEVKA